MSRKLRNQTQNDGKSRKRTLKPVVEKKRRDRINQSLAELRHLLMDATSDPRLQNPKIEKAEILDLAVEFLQKWADNASSQMETHAPLADLGHSESTALPLFSTESAGFQQCVAQLTSYMHRITPAQRASLIEGLKHQAKRLELKSGFNTKMMPDAACVETICSSDSKEESPMLLFPSYSPFQPLSCSTPCHDYLSPPPSPWFSPSFSMYSTSSPFASYACNFSFPPNLSPPSSNTSSFSFSPTVPHSSLSPFTATRPHSNPVHREVSAPNSSSPIWRPWF
ncbi:hairy-related 11 [Archocentrus centrarchus]|uniref:hairy-related 11 n=1 Tax=Archocentrus centrarchus TaxID=63155 RepID=UPI0011E9B983|nr:transcription factor HES-7-like [Archocentrus centrarchus]